jgi:acyl-CoA reductase-like NAD-dependent aldehyde dehydrogenase
MAATDETKVQDRPVPVPVKESTDIQVENPATGEIVGTVPNLSAADVAAMAVRGRAAQVGWEAMGFEGRGRVLLRAQKWLLDHGDRVVRTIISETGKAWEDAQLAELGYGAGAFGYWAKQAPEMLADERVHSSNPFVVGKKLVVRYKPLGLVGVIGPWNFPLTNSFGDCIPALAAGNAVILKPSEITPLTSLLMKEMLDECGCPEDVFQVATGEGATGAALIDEVDFIMFTGSTRTGKKVAARAAERLIPVGLELGGKDPMIVLADADVERAANAATYYSMMNAGQVCISVERVYVEEPIYDEFVAKVTEKVKALRQGPSSGPGAVDIGAVIFPPQLDIVEAHVKDAVDKGARVLTGGHGSRDGGRFHEATVLVDVDHSMKAMTEETFGPTVPIMKVADVEEAIRLANDSPYGLAASVWTKNTTKGEAVARRIEAGAVCVNDAMMNYFALEVPMGGWKSSGLGTRHGRGGIVKYCAQQTILVTKLAMKKDINMFPYKARTTRLLGRVTKLVYGRGKRA